MFLFSRVFFFYFSCKNFAYAIERSFQKFLLLMNIIEIIKFSRRKKERESLERAKRCNILSKTFSDWFIFERMQKKNFFGLNMFSMLAMSDVFNNLKSFSCSVSNKFLKRIAKLLIEDEMHPSKVVFRFLEKIRKLSKLSEIGQRVQFQKFSEISIREQHFNYSRHSIGIPKWTNRMISITHIQTWTSDTNYLLWINCLTIYRTSAIFISSKLNFESIFNQR